VIRIDDAGNPQWQNLFGGDNQEYLFQISPRGDGSFLLGGASVSGIGAPRPAPITAMSMAVTIIDYWAVEIDPVGNQRWIGLLEERSRIISTRRGDERRRLRAGWNFLV